MTMSQNARLNITSTLSILVASLGIAIPALMLILRVEFGQTYTEFLAGHITSTAQGKWQDLLAVPVFILAFYLSFSALSRVTRDIHRLASPAAADAFVEQIAWWSLPFYFGFATILLESGLTLTRAELLISALGIVALTAVVAFNRRSLQAADIRSWSVLLFLAFLLALIPINLAALLSRAPVSLVGSFDHAPFVQTSETLLIVCPALMALLLALSPQINARPWFAKALYWLSHATLPLLFVTLYPAKFFDASTSQLHAYPATIYLKAAIPALLLVSYVDVFARFRKLNPADLGRAVSPFALLALVLAIRAGTTIPPFLNPDDYHLGERLIGRWSYAHGFLPYVDYMPQHGPLDDDLAAFISSVFYDGSAATHPDASRLTAALLVAIAFFSLYAFTGSKALSAAVSLTISTFRLWMTFFVPFICLWSSSRLRARPPVWLAAWLLGSIVLILVVPGQGLVLSAAFAPLAAKMAYDLLRGRNRKELGYLAGLVIGLVVVVAVTPLYRMLLGAVEYTLQNSAINQISYGIPWKFSLNSPTKANNFLELGLEIGGASWVIPVILFLFTAQRKLPEIANRRSDVYVIGAALIFALLMIPYGFGRIDWNNLARSQFVSALFWSAFVPVLFWKAAQYARRALLALAIVCALASPIGEPAFLSRLTSAIVRRIKTPPLRDAAKEGFPNIGLAHTNAEHWARLTKLKQLLDAQLAPTEAYLDLTSRNAHYFYFNRLPPIPITAPFNMPHPNQQKRAIRILTASTPRVALFQGDNIFANLEAFSIRNYYLYRFVMDTYLPRMEDRFILGYSKQSGLLPPPESHTLSAEIKDLTDDNWLSGIGRNEPAILLSDPVLVSMLQPGDSLRFADGKPRAIQRVRPEDSAVWFSPDSPTPVAPIQQRFVEITVSPQVYQEYTASLFQRAFGLSDLMKLPIAWGRSARALQGKMTLVGELPSPFQTFHVSSTGDAYKVEGDDPQVSFDIAPFDISGRQAGLLKFDFACRGQKAEPRLKVFWWGDSRGWAFESASLRLTAEDGTLIVPLDVSPWWYVLAHVKGIRIDLDNPQACEAFRLSNLGLYQRVLD
ncbi:MAG: hypothetical protein ACK4JD_12065 [Thermoflexales bacterium]